MSRAGVEAEGQKESAMFESAELGHTVDAKVYARELPKLRARLLEAHFKLRKQSFPVIIILSGADGAGKGELVQRLNEWLDPRGVETHAFWEPSQEERERPPYWRFMRAMPGRGRIGILFGSWYSAPTVGRVYGRLDAGEFDAELERIVAFERMLAADGALFVKLWLHLPKKEQKARLRKLEDEGRIAPDDWAHFKLYDKFIRISERALRRTDTPASAWHVIEATDRRYRELATARLILEAIEGRLSAVDPAKASGSRASKPKRRTAASGKDSILENVDLSARLDDAEYGRRLEKLQRRLAKLAWEAHRKKRSMVLLFEGWDAAGKGGAIRRVTQAIDPRLYRVVGIAAPTDEERAQHYLWRFWRHLPRAGFATIFDRTWYGRVLVERVEGFATVPEWERAYQEINQFEEQIVEFGIVVAKFWLHVSPAEQLRRFREREAVAYKSYKITDEDWRNRAKWPAYQLAVEDMVARCSTEFAPWTLVAANDKRFARIQILKTVVNRLEESL
jgi:polyphosphate:AMP phosphotransferase